MDFLVPPWEHQKLAIEKASHLDYFAFFFEQGTGKTSALINTLRQKFKIVIHPGNVLQEQPIRTLIFCPPIVIDNWKREFLKYSRVSQHMITTLTGSAWMRLSATDNPRDAIYITNYQALLMDKLYQRFLTFGFEAVVCDESSKIKSYNSKTTKRVLELGKVAKYRYCLSGTPILNTASDIFPQVQFLDGGERLGNNFFKFRKEYFHDFNEHMPRHCYFPNWKMKPDTTARIQKVIEPISMRVEKKDCLDLPELVRQRIDCEMTDEQRDTYRQLEKEFVAKLGQGEIVADLAITIGLRLQQIVSGYCPNSDGEIYEFKPNGRIEATREILESITGSHKVLIWACFRENFKALEQLATLLGLKFVSVYGGIPSARQQCLVRDFEEDSNIRLLIGHPKSAGIGVNLTSASYSIFFSRSFDLADDLQAEARNYRGGSEKHSSIVRIDLTTPNTIDEVIMQALADKQNLSNAILNKYNYLRR